MKEKTPFARNLRKNQTDEEKLLWNLLRNNQLRGKKFHRQYVLGRYILDFVCFEQRLVIELDGGQHNRMLDKIKDAQRDKWLEGQGFSVLRFWNNDILNNINGVLEVIYKSLSSPQPSPRKERENKE